MKALRLNPTLTGRVRHRIEMKRGWFGRQKLLLVLQHEVEGFEPAHLGNHVGGEFRRWWVDSKPEWLTQETIVPHQENPYD